MHNPFPGDGRSLMNETRVKRGLPVVDAPLRQNEVCVGRYNVIAESAKNVPRSRP
jgi:hypothetical protein